MSENTPLTNAMITTLIDDASISGLSQDAETRDAFARELELDLRASKKREEHVGKMLAQAEAELKAANQKFDKLAGTTIGETIRMQTALRNLIEAGDKYRMEHVGTRGIWFDEKLAEAQKFL